MLTKEKMLKDLKDPPGSRTQWQDQAILKLSGISHPIIQAPWLELKMRIWRSLLRKPANWSLPCTLSMPTGIRNELSRFRRAVEASVNLVLEFPYVGGTRFPLKKAAEAMNPSDFSSL